MAVLRILGDTLTIEEFSSSPCPFYLRGLSLEFSSSIELAEAIAQLYFPGGIIVRIERKIGEKNAIQAQREGSLREESGRLDSPEDTQDNSGCQRASSSTEGS